MLSSYVPNPCLVIIFQREVSSTALCAGQHPELRCSVQNEQTEGREGSCLGQQQLLVGSVLNTATAIILSFAFSTLICPSLSTFRLFGFSAGHCCSHLLCFCCQPTTGFLAVKNSGQVIDFCLCCLFCPKMMGQKSS